MIIDLFTVLVDFEGFNNIFERLTCKCHNGLNLSLLDNFSCLFPATYLIRKSEHNHVLCTNCKVFCKCARKICFVPTYHKTLANRLTKLVNSVTQD